MAQSPPGCIVQVAGVCKPPLFDFDVLQEYIIPRAAFFNRYVTVNDPDNKYAVLGFPVCIAHTKYHRNQFIFNFGLVVEADVDQVPYERVVRRLAATFAEMEKQNEFLSLDARRGTAAAADAAAAIAVVAGAGLGAAGSGSGDLAEARRPIESLLEIIKEDLNNYGECMIPVDDANTINMKLFPHHPPPPLVKGWHVPVAKMKFADVVDPTWDLTLQKVIAHIDGVSDVRRIAWAADVSLDLAQAALRHLLYYDTILLLDLFLFGAAYALRPGAGGASLADFVANAGGVVDECAAYVCLHGRRVSNFDLVRLMVSFCPGRSVAEWLKGHMDSGFRCAALCRRAPLRPVRRHQGLPVPRAQVRRLQAVSGCPRHGTGSPPRRR